MENYYEFLEIYMTTLHEDISFAISPMVRFTTCLSNPPTE